MPISDIAVTEIFRIVNLRSVKQPSNQSSERKFATYSDNGVKTSFHQNLIKLTQTSKQTQTISKQTSYQLAHDTIITNKKVLQTEAFTKQCSAAKEAAQQETVEDAKKIFVSKKRLN